MANSDDAFEARAERRRRTWDGVVGPGHVPVQASESTIEQRIAAMRWVADTPWAFAGRALPEYRREDMPGRAIRPS